MITTRATSLLAAFALLITTGMSVSVQDDLTEQQTTSLLKEVTRALRAAKDDHTWAEVLYRLEEVRSSSATELVGARLLHEKSVDRQLIAAELLATYTEPEKVRESAGTALQKSIERKKADLDVLESCVTGLGKLKFAPAIKSLGVVLDRRRRDPWLPLAVLKAYGKIGDRAALPFIHATWKKMDDEAEAGARGGGTGGGGGGTRPSSSGGAKRTPPVAGALRDAFIAAAQQLTKDDEIETSDALAEWLEFNPPDKSDESD